MSNTIHLRNAQTGKRQPRNTRKICHGELMRLKSGRIVSALGRDNTYHATKGWRSTRLSPGERQRLEKAQQKLPTL